MHLALLTDLLRMSQNESFDAPSTDICPTYVLVYETGLLFNQRNVFTISVTFHIFQWNET